MGEDNIKKLANDEGEAITFIMKMLLIDPIELLNSQHHVIFRIRCTINGKACDLLTDIRCNENITFLICCLDTSTQDYETSITILNLLC